ncbi:hypothetical protein D3D02_17100 [Halobellus sp. Atlit-38R]|nr:hypothetical protein D3D02_17100 [Halobellus sp. Atlit-38R]
MRRERESEAKLPPSSLASDLDDADPSLVPDGGLRTSNSEVAMGTRPIARARLLLASALAYSCDDEPAQVARRLDTAQWLLDGQVDVEVWYRVHAVKRLSCRGDSAAARREMREVMSLLDAELEAI